MAWKQAFIYDTLDKQQAREVTVGGIYTSTVPYESPSPCSGTFVRKLAGAQEKCVTPRARALNCKRKVERRRKRRRKHRARDGDLIRFKNWTLSGRFADQHGESNGFSVSS